ncbi:MAG: sulfite exporter TauE/SafE family protein [Bacteroidales bacterium]|nr:sulfite exporter TauE/SafE family protein [Bacteroidales bacterium]
MNNEILILSVTAASTGFIHTLAGPDHYLPFIVLAKARQWSVIRTAWITFLCGLGHVGTSVLIGLTGVALGIGMEHIEGIRGNIAAWILVIFGFLYMLWGIRRAIQNKAHKHIHIHKDGIVHDHEHLHVKDHEHEHKIDKAFNYTPWILFLIFFLGPCELLIPQLLVPAAGKNVSGLIIVAAVFSVFTILTMLVIVLLTTYILKPVSFGKLEKYSHAIAGAIIFLSGFAIIFLGL